MPSGSPAVISGHYLLGFLQLLWDENDNQSQSHGNQRPYLLGFLQLLLDLLLARRALYLDAHSVPNARRNP